MVDPALNANSEGNISIFRTNKEHEQLSYEEYCCQKYE